MGRKKKYLTEEERQAAQREQIKQWKAANKEHVAGYNAEYKEKNKEKIAEYNAEYYSTSFGRASNLLHGYKQSDNLYNRGECTLTADWIVQNIFNQPCHYCGETDWHELGCDRIDNNLPHTPDNVVPCCCECNKKKARYSYDDFMKLIGKIA